MWGTTSQIIKFSDNFTEVDEKRRGKNPGLKNSESAVMVGSWTDQGVREPTSQ